MQQSLMDSFFEEAEQQNLSRYANFWRTKDTDVLIETRGQLIEMQMKGFYPSWETNQELPALCLVLNERGVTFSEREDN